MKVLIVSLACFRKNWRQKFVFASRYRDFTFKFIVPHKWEYYSFPNTYERDGYGLDIIEGKIAFIGRPGRHFYYTGLLKTILNFRPDIIHIEHEPESIVTLQTIFFRNVFLPGAKIVLRTSRTFESRLRFSKIRNLMEQYVYREIDYALCVNQKSRDFLKREGYTGPARLHPNGVDPILFSPRNVTPLKEKLGLKGSRVIGYVGRLVKEKGVDTLVTAIGELKEKYKLLLVGVGPELVHLQEIARDKGFEDRLIAIGKIRQESVPQYLNCMDVLVLPSITTDYWEEYFGMILIESLACGVPVIGSTCGEIPNIIGERRLIFQEGSLEDLKEKLIGLFENYKEWKKWAEGNISRVKNTYSWEVLGTQIIEIYNELR